MRRLVACALCAGVLLAVPATSSAVDVKGCPSSFTVRDVTAGTAAIDKNGDGKICRMELPEPAQPNAIGIDNNVKG